MIRLVEWLATRRRLTLVLVLVYSAANILSHELIQQIVLAAYDRFSREKVNTAVQIVSVLLIAALTRYLWKYLRPPDQRYVKIEYLAISACLIAASWRWLFFTDAEAVHFPQYALLAMLIFPLTRRFGHAVFYATLAGVLDECVQFYITHPTWGSHLDLNDMIFNLVGAGLGCTLLFVGGAGRLVKPMRDEPLSRRLLRSGPIWTTAAIALLCTGLWLGGLLTLDPLPDGTKTRLTLRRVGPSPTFWRTTSWGARYHDLSPVEALLLGGILLCYYGSLDVRARRAGAGKPIKP